jgi:hypothetical protein
MASEALMNKLDIGGVVAVLALAVTALWFCVHEDQRIYKLETQVQTLSTAPLISQKSPSGHGPPLIMENPLLAECADLANKSAQAALAAQYTQYTTINDEMKQLNCTLKPSLNGSPSN